MTGAGPGGGETGLFDTMLITLSLALVPCQIGVTPGPHVECNAENARFNLTAVPRSGYDFIPITPDDTLGFYVVYSARQDDSGTGVGSTASIYVLPLSGGELLIFGGGWGDTNWAGWALYDADHDVALVTEIVRGCLRLEPALTRVRFVAPHGHPDHINAAFMKALDRAGYQVAEIVYHEGDGGWIESLPWLPQHAAVLRSLAGGGCSQQLLHYDSPLGKVWFFHRPGHTAGSVDLVLDVLGDPADRVLVRGSTKSWACPNPPSGTKMALEAHGTALLPRRRGEVSIIAGQQLNTLCLSSLARPRIGKSWTGMVDASNHEGAAFVVLTGTERRLDPGIVLRHGELLIDLESNLLLSAQIVSSGEVDVLDFPIPNDPMLIGTTTYVQATILGGGIELCNALELVVGF